MLCRTNIRRLCVTHHDEPSDETSAVHMRTGRVQSTMMNWQRPWGRSEVYGSSSPVGFGGGLRGGLGGMGSMSIGATVTACAPA
jgi:hypothetical protein